MSKRMQTLCGTNYFPMRKNIFMLLLVLCVMLFSEMSMANDFPTQARAEYVFACMSSNGQTSEMLTKCSCAIDAIAEQMTYKEYEEAETVLSMRLVAGDRTAMFKESAWAVDIVSRFNEIQVEADVQCF